MPMTNKELHDKLNEAEEIAERYLKEAVSSLKDAKYISFDEICGLKEGLKVIAMVKDIQKEIKSA